MVKIIVPFETESELLQQMLFLLNICNTVDSFLKLNHTAEIWLSSNQLWFSFNNAHDIARFKAKYCPTSA